MKEGGIINRAYYTIQISISNPIASPHLIERGKIPSD